MYWCITSQSLLSVDSHPHYTYFLVTLPSWLSAWVSWAQSYSPPAPLCVQQHRGEFSATRKRDKTMGSVRQSRSNGFTTASSPPLLSMRKSINRILIVLAMHDAHSCKWTWKQTRTPAELAQNILWGMYWTDFLFYLKNGANAWWMFQPDILGSLVIGSIFTASISL